MFVSVNIFGRIVNCWIYRCDLMLIIRRQDMISVNYQIKYLYNYKLQWSFIKFIKVRSVIILWSITIIVKNWKSNKSTWNSLLNEFFYQFRWPTNNSSSFISNYRSFHNFRIIWYKFNDLIIIHIWRINTKGLKVRVVTAD